MTIIGSWSWEGFIPAVVPPSDTYTADSSVSFVTSIDSPTLPALGAGEAWLVSVGVMGSGSGYLQPSITADLGGTVTPMAEVAAWWNQPIGSRQFIVSGPTSAGVLTATVASGRLMIISATKVAGFASSPNQIAAAGGYSGDGSGAPVATLPGAALSGTSGIILANFSSGPAQGLAQVESGWTVLAVATVFGAFGLDLVTAWRYSNGDNTAQNVSNTTQQTIGISEIAVL